MEKKDYYRQNKKCLLEGIATSKENEDAYRCGKFGGECRLLKCVSSHNNKKTKAPKVVGG
jgi:hypothetical protein